MKGAVYNEIDPFAAQWLRNLIMADLIAPGDVDERSILDVSPDDWRGYAQVHCFAGIGVWSYSLRRAGWPDHRPVWTGSCPCQPFSQAGKGGGFDDERHLWPAWHHLIRECRPDRVLGEQVASKDGLQWLDLVSSDLEGSGYAFGATDQCVAGFGGPHIRQRLFFVGLQQPQGDGRDQRRAESERRDLEPRRGASGLCEPHSAGSQPGRLAPAGLGHRGSSEPAGGTGRISDSQGDRRPGRPDDSDEGRRERASGPDGAVGGLPHHHHQGLALGSEPPDERGALRFEGSALGADEPVRGFWSGADWIWFRDGRYRPVEPGTFPLAHGAPARVGRLRAYGNAICAEVAQGFVEAVMDCIP